jgi:hypothetical protein
MLLPTIPESEILTYKFVFVQDNPAPVDFTSGTGSQTSFLVGVPNNYAICAVKINPTITFVGPSLATMTCSVGVSANNTYYAPAYSIVQSAAFQVTTPLSQFQSTAHDINAYFVTTGASINAITAGQVEITLQMRPLP